MFSAEDLNRIPTQPTNQENLISTTANRIGLESWDQPSVILQPGDRIPGSPSRPTPRDIIETAKLVRPGFFARLFRR